MMKWGLKLSLGIVLVAGIFFACPKSKAQMAGVLVYPNILELNFTSPNKRFDSKAVWVENPTKTTYRVRVYSQDWDVNQFGEVKFLEEPVENSLKNKIKFNPYEFDVKPGQKQLVRLTAKRPDGPDGEYRHMIFFETVTPRKDLTNPDKDNVSFMINFKTRFGVALYAYKGNVSKSTVIHSFNLKNDNKQPFIYAGIKSDGNIHSSLKGVFVLKDPKNKNAEKPVYETEISYTSLPHREQILKIHLPKAKIADGEYLANLTLIYNDLEGKLQTIQAEKMIFLDANQTTVKKDLAKPVSEDVKKTKDNIAAPIELE